MSCGIGYFISLWVSGTPTTMLPGHRRLSSLFAQFALGENFDPGPAHGLSNLGADPQNLPNTDNFHPDGRGNIAEGSGGEGKGQPS